jgi:hypothetical protein
MYLIYIDDSYEKPTIAYSGVAVHVSHWRQCFEQLKTWRHSLKKSDGILVSREFHATEFVGGRGNLGPRIVTKHRRSQIFYSAFQMMNGMNLHIFNACLKSNPDWAFERLLNRINRTMEKWDNHAMLLCDEGKEAEYTRLVRKMSVYNPIPSRYGLWQDTGEPTKNITLSKIIEDPIFKKSNKSYFVQLADFCAYGLLRREQHLASKNRYNIHKAFDELAKVAVRACNPRDPMGVIR